MVEGYCVATKLVARTMEVDCPDVTANKAAEQAKYNNVWNNVIVPNIGGTRVIWIVQSRRIQACSDLSMKLKMKMKMKISGTNEWGMERKLLWPAREK